MKDIQNIIDNIKDSNELRAFVWESNVYTFGDLVKYIDRSEIFIEESNIIHGSIVSIEDDISPFSLALMLALFIKNCIVVPISPSATPHLEEFLETSEVEYRLSTKGGITLKEPKNTVEPKNKLIIEFKQKKAPGLILFSSGSTGKNKAILHNALNLFQKKQCGKQDSAMLSFLLFDHIGGINTIIFGLQNHCCIVVPDNRSPAAVCKSIQDFKIEVLPTSPTFLNLLLASEAYNSYDLSSLRMITYGTEPMSESTLSKLNFIFPGVKLLQTYGLSELGILKIKSKSNESLMVDLRSDDYQYRVRNDILEIKTENSMFGYLNACSPFTEDGWFITDDIVQQHGDYIKILGRSTDLINVGGEKVYPVEIENVLQKIPGVKLVSVTGESHPLIGQMVVARFNLYENEKLSEFREKVYSYCRGILPRYKTPQKVIIEEKELHNARFKKQRG